MMTDRGKLLFQDTLFNHVKAIGEMIFYIVGICLWSIVILIVIYYWDDEYIFTDLFIIGAMIANNIFFIYKINKIIKTYDFVIYENGVIRPKLHGRYRSQDDFIAFEHIKQIRFFSWGLGVRLFLDNGAELDISNNDGEKPYRMLVNILIHRFNIQDKPDYSILDDFGNYKTKEEKKTAMLKHMEMNRRFK